MTNAAKPTEQQKALLKRIARQLAAQAAKNTTQHQQPQHKDKAA
jgi:hypothetical protein